MNSQHFTHYLEPALLNEIERNLIQELHSCAEGRKKDVKRGAETRELAALMFEKFGYGMVRAVGIIGLQTKLMQEVDKLAREIDPDFDTTKQMRWGSRPAALSFTIDPLKK
ncbi:MAG TPA: hypothetical protein VIE65_07000 [Methylobacter sp.]